MKLAVVYVANGHPQAQVIKTKLESEGIPALLQYESLGLIYGITVNGLGEVRVMVPESMAQEARQILAEPSNLPQSDEP